MSESEQSENLEPEARKRVPCLHDPRKFVNCLPHSMDPGLLRKIINQRQEFLSTCPYESIAGSKYCRPHTIMNNAVGPHLQDDINEFVTHTIKCFAAGYVHLVHGQLYRDITYFANNCIHLPLNRKQMSRIQQQLERLAQEQ